MRISNELDAINNNRETGIFSLEQGKRVQEYIMRISNELDAVITKNNVSPRG